MKKIAVILCGCGFKDGSEIRESVGVLWALSQFPVQVQCFAPNEPQKDVVNCLTRTQVKGETRNMLVESARIARSEILPLEDLNTQDFAACIIPGGFGVAKNLCSFAERASQGKVHPLLEKKLKEFHAQSKPLGAVCIAPAVLALTFSQPLELTLGPICEASKELEKLGHKMISTSATECHVDHGNKIVSTAAYMCDTAKLHEIFEGIRKLVVETLNMI